MKWAGSAQSNEEPRLLNILKCISLQPFRTAFGQCLLVCFNMVWCNENARNRHINLHLKDNTEKCGSGGIRFRCGKNPQTI